MLNALMNCRMRGARWIALVALAALIPLTSGCSVLEDAAMFWGLGYAHELLFTPARSLFATGLLDFINTH